jgi:hypothetical protein
MPWRADSDVASAITSGTASPSASGQEITSTGTVRVTAASASPTSSSHTKVIVAVPVAM